MTRTTWLFWSTGKCFNCFGRKTRGDDRTIVCWQCNFSRQRQRRSICQCPVLKRLIWAPELFSLERDLSRRGRSGLKSPRRRESGLVLGIAENGGYCTISIDSAGGCDAWHSGRNLTFGPLAVWQQTEIATNILWHFKKKGNWSMKGIVSDNLVYFNKPIEGIVAYHGLQLVLVQNLCTNSSWTIFLTWNITTFNNNVWITTTCFWAVSTW